MLGRSKQKRLSGQESLFVSYPPHPGEGVCLDLGPLTPLAPPFPPDGCFPLPLPLGTGLLIETPLPELRIEPGPLDLPLEPAQGPVEAFVVLDKNFQTNHTPFGVFQNEHFKVEKEGIQGNRPSR
jgi:hypothetical protein